MMKMKKENIFLRIFKNHNFRFLIFGLIVATVPIWVNMGILKTAMLGIFGGTIIYMISALGMNLLLGYSGLISLGTAGFMGLGAYISAICMTTLGIPWFFSMVISVVVSTLLGILVGLVSLRINGLYLGIVTLCISEILRKTFEELTDITGGYSGMKADYPTIFGYEFTQTQTYLLYCGIMVLMMILVYNLVHGQLGRALNAMRGSSVAAQAMGISIIKYRLVAFALSTGFAALAGSMYVHFINYTSPTAWTLVMSLNIMAIVVIGGLRSIYGTFIGAVVVYAFSDLVLKRIPVVGSINGFAYIVSGVLIIVVVMFYPGGLVKLFSDLKNLVLKLFAKKKNKTEKIEGGQANE